MIKMPHNANSTFTVKYCKTWKNCDYFCVHILLLKFCLLYVLGFVILQSCFS